jgi:hypothetical protein
MLALVVAEMFAVVAARQRRPSSGLVELRPAVGELRMSRRSPTPPFINRMIADALAEAFREWGHGSGCVVS